MPYNTIFLQGSIVKLTATNIHVLVLVSFIINKLDPWHCLLWQKKQMQLIP